MELRFTFKGESTHCPCRQCQPSIRCVTRNIFLLVKPHPSCYACNVFSNFSCFKGDASYFSDILSPHVPGTGLGHLPRLAQTLTTILQVTIKFILQMSKLTGPGLPSQQVVESKFNLSDPRTISLFHNKLLTHLPVPPSLLTGLHLVSWLVG